LREKGRGGTGDEKRLNGVQMSGGSGVWGDKSCLGADPWGICGPEVVHQWDGGGGTAAKFFTTGWVVYGGRGATGGETSMGWSCRWSEAPPPAHTNGTPGMGLGNAKQVWAGDM